MGSYTDRDHNFSPHHPDSISMRDEEDTHAEQLSGGEVGHQWTFSERSTSDQRTLAPLPTLMAEGGVRVGASATYTKENSIALDCPVGASTVEDSHIECAVRTSSRTERYEVKQESERMQDKAETELSHEHSMTRSSL